MRRVGVRYVAIKERPLRASWRQSPIPAESLNSEALPVRIFPRSLTPSVTLVLEMPDATQAVDILVVPASKGPVAAGAETAVTAPDPVGPLYEELERRVHALRPNEDLTALRKAFEFAAARHLGQKRVSGEPYMVHPLMVTLQLADMHMDLVCLETGLLHDVVEDTTATLAEVKKEFGDDVARVVDGVTKLSKLNLASREERQAESVRKMLLAMVNDIRVIMVKLADRLHNMRTLGSLSPERQE